MIYKTCEQLTLFHENVSVTGKEISRIGDTVSIIYYYIANCFWKTVVVKTAYYTDRMRRASRTLCILAFDGDVFLLPTLCREARFGKTYVHVDIFVNGNYRCVWSYIKCRI